MKILLTAINAKYIHSNPAVYSLRAYAMQYREHISLAEFTINHRRDYILREIYKKKPDVLCFSCYIWNVSYVTGLIRDLHKLMPRLPIWVGGPEVSYESESFLRQFPMVKGVMRGEGEETFRELCGYYISREDPSAKTGKMLKEIAGLLYRGEGEGLVDTGDRPPLDLNTLPFCYGGFDDPVRCSLQSLSNRIIYYETSRGCPFRCSYCLSSIDKSLRFRSMELVKQELSFFLKHNVSQVKFTDRTFNCKKEHAMAVWRFLKEKDNGVTNFHFEIAADLLTEEEITLLKSLRPGLVQLEIGVQTTNPCTLKEIRRSMDLERLEWAVSRIKEGKNIHQHLDLIAGLPYEDYSSFVQSFDRIYRLHPQQLQLGFLKVLKGSFLYERRQEYGVLYQEEPPYEVLATRWLRFDELLQIKLAEEMLEVYYNSGQFGMTMQVLELLYESPFALFAELGNYYEKMGLFAANHSRIRRCEILLEFIGDKEGADRELLKETLTFDLYLRENSKSRPGWAPDPSLFKKETKEFCKKGKESHIEPFYYDFTELLNNDLTKMPHRQEEWRFYLFSYGKRDSLTGQAAAVPAENRKGESQ